MGEPLGAGAPDHRCGIDRASAGKPAARPHRSRAPYFSRTFTVSEDFDAPKVEASGILGFYMGKNTPERKDYIMGNLVVPVEE